MGLEAFEFGNEAPKPKQEEPLKLRIIEGGKRSVDESKLEEALKWHKLFREGWMTAHDLEGVSREADPDVEGVEYKIETENLLKIKELVDLNLSDEEFRQKLPEIQSMLPRQFEAMEGFEQSSPHGDFDPVEHTINALRLLEVDDLEERDKKIARVALIFHDVGKVVNPTSRAHPYRSEEIAVDHLEKMGFAEEDKIEILAQVRYHDALGEVARRDGHNMFDEKEALLMFPNQRQLDIHYKVARADIESIPGLSWAIYEIDETYELMSEKIREKSHLKEVEKMDLPFERVDGKAFLELRGRLFEEVDFDDVNIKEEIKYRRTKFEGGSYSGKRFKKGEEIDSEFKGVSREIQEKVEKLMVEYSLENDKKLLSTLRLTGREVDLEYVNDLENKYNIKLDNLRIAVYMHKITYRLWELRFDVGKISGENDPNLKKIEEKLLEIKKSAKILSQYVVETSHCTDEESAESIEEDSSIMSSLTTYKKHYEGDGVYTGMFQTFRDWGDNIFIMKTKLANTFPMLVDYKYPKAMANTLSESIDLVEEDGEVISYPSGLVYWRDYGLRNEEITDWKLNFLEKMLGTKAELAEGEYGKVVIADTTEDPIVWGLLCRALKVTEFIPWREIQRLELENEFDFKDPELNKKGFSEVEKHDYYSGLACKAIRIKGISSEDLENL